MEHPKFYVPYFPPKKSRFSELVQTGRNRASWVSQGVINSNYLSGWLNATKTTTIHPKQTKAATSGHERGPLEPRETSLWDGMAPFRWDTADRPLMKFLLLPFLCNKKGSAGSCTNNFRWLHIGDCMGAISCKGLLVTATRRNAALCHTVKIDLIKDPISKSIK